MSIADRSIKNAGPWRRREVKSAEYLCVFVHGLAGDNGDDYWGKIPEFLAYERDFRSVDLAWWEYPTHRWPSPRLFEVYPWGRRLPSVPEVGDALATALRDLAAEKSYRGVVLVGHSMGGFVILEMLNSLNIQSHSSLPAIEGTSRVLALGMLGTPFWTTKIAFLASFLFFKSNKQINYLSSRKWLLDFMTSSLRLCKQLNILTGYIGALEDHVAKLVPGYRVSFDFFEVVSGAHLWMPEAETAQHPSYVALVQFLKKCIQQTSAS